MPLCSFVCSRPVSPPRGMNDAAGLIREIEHARSRHKTSQNNTSERKKVIRLGSKDTSGTVLSSSSTSPERQ